MSEPQYICKRCEVSRDYDAIGKKLDPRQGERGTICEPCWNECMAELAGAHKQEPSASDFATDKMFKRSGTSSDAAQAASKSAKLNDTHRTIYKLLSETPATPDRIAFIMDAERNTVRARMSEMAKAGFITDTGDTAPTQAGRNANVMRITTPEERQEAA